MTQMVSFPELLSAPDAQNDARQSQTMVDIWRVVIGMTGKRVLEKKKSDNFEKKMCTIAITSVSHAPSATERTFSIRTAEALLRSSDAMPDRSFAALPTSPTQFQFALKRNGVLYVTDSLKGGCMTRADAIRAFVVPGRSIYCVSRTRARGSLKKTKAKRFDKDEKNVDDGFVLVS